MVKPIPRRIRSSYWRKLLALLDKYNKVNHPLTRDWICSQSQMLSNHLMVYSASPMTCKQNYINYWCPNAIKEKENECIHTDHLNSDTVLPIWNVIGEITSIIDSHNTKWNTRLVLWVPHQSPRSLRPSFLLLTLLLNLTKLTLTNTLNFCFKQWIMFHYIQDMTSGAIPSFYK